MGIRTLSIVHQMVKNHQEVVLIHMIVIKIKFVFMVSVKILLIQAVVTTNHVEDVSNALWVLASSLVLHHSIGVKKGTCVILACVLKIRGVHIVQEVTDVTGNNVFQCSIALLTRLRIAAGIAA